MLKSRIISVACLSLSLALAAPVAAPAQSSLSPISTSSAEPADVCLITGVDNSGSMYRDSGSNFNGHASMGEVLMSFTRVLNDPTIHGLITSGKTGRTLVGFYFWSQKDQHSWFILPQVVIRNDRQSIMPVINAMAIAAKHIEAIPYNNKLITETPPDGEIWRGWYTHVSSGVHYGLVYLAAANCQNKVLNIVTDDHITRADYADTLLTEKKLAKNYNITINGLVVGKTNATLSGTPHYFDTLLRSGDHSFVINAQTYNNLDLAVRRKFQLDMVSVPLLRHASLH